MQFFFKRMKIWKSKDPPSIRTEINGQPPLLIHVFTLTCLLPLEWRFRGTLMKSTSQVNRQVGFRRDPTNPIWDPIWEWQDSTIADIDIRIWSQDLWVMKGGILKKQRFSFYYDWNQCGLSYFNSCFYFDLPPQKLVLSMLSKLSFGGCITDHNSFYSINPVHVWLALPYWDIKPKKLVIGISLIWLGCSISQVSITLVKILN